MIYHQYFEFKELKIITWLCTKLINTQHVDVTMFNLFLTIQLCVYVAALQNYVLYSMH